MRVAIVAESFLPVVNGVVNSVLRVLEHLRRHGHEALVIAPAAKDGQEEITHYLGHRVVRVPAVDVPGINSLPIGVPLPRVLTEMRDFQPDVVHLASPFVLGAAGAAAAKTLGLPCVAIYQTDVAGFANNYNMAMLSKVAWRVTRTLHNNCTMTLAPSSVTIKELEEHGVRDVFHWGRGVDIVRFNPAKRSEELRASWIDAGRSKRAALHEGRVETFDEQQVTVVGFVGRLAAEKSVERLAVLDDRDDIQLVIVGDGPEREDLEKRMPTAVFTGGMYGEDLPQAFASLDIFVHAGQFETFCQAIQEAHASGVATIGPRAGGPIDLITPGINGHLLDVDTFERDLPGAVEDIINRGVKGFGAAAFEGVQSKSWPGLCSQLMDYYELAIDMRGQKGLLSRKFFRKGPPERFMGVAADVESMMAAATSTGALAVAAGERLRKEQESPARIAAQEASSQRRPEDVTAEPVRGVVRRPRKAGQSEGAGSNG